MSDKHLRAESDARLQAAYLYKLKRDLIAARAQVDHWRHYEPEHSDVWAVRVAFLEREIAARQPC